MTFHQITTRRDFIMLREQANHLRSAGCEPHSLWIACTDLSLDGPLHRVTQAGPTLLLRRPGPQVIVTETEAQDELSAVNYAVERLRVKHIVLCGHSLCSAIPFDVSGNLPVEPTQVESLIQRARRREVLNQHSRQHLVRQLQLLRAYPAVTRALAEGELQIDVLFYLVESGLFTLYDSLSGEFVPTAVNERGSFSSLDRTLQG